LLYVFTIYIEEVWHMLDDKGYTVGQVTVTVDGGPQCFGQHTIEEESPWMEDRSALVNTPLRKTGFSTSWGLGFKDS
jgi:hypothetical protein